MTINLHGLYCLMPKPTTAQKLRSTVGKLLSTIGRLKREHKAALDRKDIELRTEWHKEKNKVFEHGQTIERLKQALRDRVEVAHMELANEKEINQAANAEARYWRQRARTAEEKWSRARWGVRLHNFAVGVGNVEHREYLGSVDVNRYLQQAEAACEMHREACNMLHKIPGVEQIHDCFIVPLQKETLLDHLHPPYLVQASPPISDRYPGIKGTVTGRITGHMSPNELRARAGLGPHLRKFAEALGAEWCGRPAAPYLKDPSEYQVS